MRRSIKKVAAGLLATMMIGTMLTGCGGGNKKDSGSSNEGNFRDQHRIFTGWS